MRMRLGSLGMLNVLLFRSRDHKIMNPYCADRMEPESGAEPLVSALQRTSQTQVSYQANLVSHHIKFFKRKQ